MAIAIGIIIIIVAAICAVVVIKGMGENEKAEKELREIWNK